MGNSKKFTPLPHQTEGSQFLRRRKAAALFDEQGLGKSKQLIDAIDLCLKDGSVDGAILVCPNHLKDNWREEIEKHSPGTRVVVLGSGKAERRRSLTNLRGRYYVVNYEALPLEITVLRALLKFKRFAVVLDESHRIKSPGSQVTTAVRALQSLAARRYILTGSPVSNRPEDLWSQFFFLDEGERLGKTPDDFHRKFGDSSTGYRSLGELAGHLDSIGLRRTKATHLKLPPKRIVRESVTLPPNQRALYDTMRDDTRIWIQSLSGTQVLRQADSILARLTALVQLASNPRLIDHSYTEVPGKIETLDRILGERLNSTSAKAIVWTSFVEHIPDLKERYKQYGPVTLYGEVGGKERRAVVKAFRSDPDTRLLIANPAAAREGLTLVEANCAIYLDRTFNLVDYLQSQDRIHRIGQTKECEIILLLATNSIDAYVDFALEQKRRVAGFLQGDTSRITADDAAFRKPALLRSLTASRAKKRS